MAKHKPMGWKLKEGYAYNPSLKLPRNSKCRCDSGFKFKDCCLNRIPRYVTEAQADKIKKDMQHPDFKFVLYDKRQQEMGVSDDNLRDISMGTGPLQPWLRSLGRELYV